MIDLHNHILFGLDDGAATEAVSLAMLSYARDLGYRGIVATPHLSDRLTEDYEQRARDRLAVLQPRAEALGLTLSRGFEILLAPDLARRLDDGEASAIAGTRFVLVELPFVGWPAYTDDALFALQSAGYRPILAHPERYHAVQKDPRVAIELAQRGVLLQLTARSLVASSRRVRQVSEQLVRSGAVSLVASDAHGVDHRYQSVTDGLRRLTELIGAERAEQIVKANSAAVLADGDIDVAGTIDAVRDAAATRTWWHPGSWFRRTES